MAAPAFLHAAQKSTDARIDGVEYSYEDFLYRAPIKFGGNVVDRVTMLNVTMTMRSRAGKVAKGFGSMPMGNVWGFPSKVHTYGETLDAMKALTARLKPLIGGYREYGHPLDVAHALMPSYMKAADEVTREQKLKEPFPALCTLVTASPFDAALHDGFGKLHGRSSYQILSPEFVSHDLSHYLSPAFAGEYPDRYVTANPKSSMPLYHLVGAVDPLTSGDIAKRIGDGLPETLPEWIEYSGLDHLKIKLNGEDMNGDVTHVLSVERVAGESMRKRKVARWVYSLDFNEKCPNVEYLVACLRKVNEGSTAAYERIQYVEQPTKRDLKADRGNRMHEAAKLKPVVIDESLTSLEMLELAREMGYSGTALKACKGQGEALLMGAAAQKYKMFLCVQDLTCPGASLIHSAGLAAHVPTVAAIECNSRQYVPVANNGWEQRFPGVFDVRNGRVNTGVLDKPGLSAVA